MNTVRVTELERFRDEADTENKPVLQLVNTRFLSLLPAIKRLFQMYRPLISFSLARQSVQHLA
jgi:hypothetical protein